MAIKCILLPVSGYEADESALVAALGLAKSLGAFVEAIHVKPDPREAVPLVAEGAAGSVVAQMIDLAEKESAGRADHAQRLFESAAKKAGVALSGPSAGARFATAVGRAADEIAVRARVADLTVVVRITGEALVEWNVTVEAALMEGGRPLLILPAGLKAWSAATVALGWNGSAEAARAAAASLPLLAPARRVILLAGVKEIPVEPSLSQLADWLAHHGIKAETRKIALKGWPVEGEIVDEARAAGAELLVMGAYGHSRMREVVFGGATRAVLDDAGIPVLLMH
ncbi:MAG TPA: universal stress protein [Alphaproteobacteria bacterium]|nr:universal stress protein [Alphaproteobacteria bacterium]